MTTEAPSAPVVVESATPAPAAPVVAAPVSTPAAPAAPSSGFLGGAPLASGAPAAAPPAHFFGEHVQKDGQFQEGWTQGLQTAGFERLANKAALAKDEGSLLRSLDEALGMVGKKAGIAYPKAGASDVEVAAFRADAGVPMTAAEYGLRPEKLPDGVEWDDASMQGYAEIFHQGHVPKDVAQALVAKHLEQVAAQGQQATQQFSQKISGYAEKSEQTFKTEWGVDYEQRLESNRAFVASRFQEADLSDPVLQAALSHPGIVRMIDEARRGLREAPLPGVGAEMGGGSHSPRQQAVAIQQANPNWEKDPSMHKRVMDLYSLDAAQTKRGKR